MMEHSLSLEEYVSHILKGHYKPKKAHELLYHAVQHAIQHNHIPQDVDKRLVNQINEQYLYPASLGYDLHKRMLILVGPPGSGKSSIVRFLKRALEIYSHTNEGAVYQISGCPMQEDPLLALPDNIREQLPLTINGNLSPYNLMRLQNEWKRWKDVPVERFYISESHRTGIGTFFPADPFSQDTSDLIGSIDYALITKYGSPSDPRAYRYDGEFQAANRGLLELQEVFKAEPKILYPFLSLADEGQYKISRQSILTADEVVIGHTNEPDLFQMIQDEPSPILNRMIFIKVGYTLSIEQEVHIYKQKITKNDIGRLGYQALESLAAALIFTRIKKPLNGLTKIETLKEFNSHQHEEQAMSGLDPRYAFQVLSIVCAKNLKEISAHDLLDELKRIIKEDYRLPSELKDGVLYSIQLAYKYYEFEWLELMRSIIVKADSEGILHYIHHEKELIHKALGMDESNQAELESSLNHLKVDLTNITIDDLPLAAKDAVIDSYVFSKKDQLEKWFRMTVLPCLRREGYYTNKPNENELLKLFMDRAGNYF